MQHAVSPLSLGMWLSVYVVVATSSSLCNFSDVDVSSIRPLESYWKSLVLSSAPRRIVSRILLLSSSRALWLHTSIGQGPWTHFLYLPSLSGNMQTGVKVEGLQIPRRQQNLRHLLSSRRAHNPAIQSCSLFFPRWRTRSSAWSRGSLPTFLSERSRWKIKGSSIKCAEFSFTNSLTLPGSSSFVVHYAEIVCKLDSPFSVLRCHQWNTSTQCFGLNRWLFVYGTPGFDISFSASCSSDGF